MIQVLIVILFSLSVAGPVHDCSDNDNFSYKIKQTSLDKSTFEICLFSTNGRRIVWAPENSKPTGFDCPECDCPKCNCVGDQCTKLVNVLTSATIGTNYTSDNCLIIPFNYPGSGWCNNGMFIDFVDLDCLSENGVIPAGIDMQEILNNGIGAFAIDTSTWHYMSHRPKHVIDPNWWRGENGEYKTEEELIEARCP